MKTNRLRMVVVQLVTGAMIRVDILHSKKTDTVCIRVVVAERKT